MSDYEVGYKKPPKHSQFKPGISPNPKGRPKKQKRVLLPSQLRKDFLRESDELVEIKTPQGKRRATKSELIVKAIVNGAVRGNPTCLKMWASMQGGMHEQRLEEYASVRLVQMLQAIVEDPTREASQLDIETYDGMIKHIKNLY